MPPFPPGPDRSALHALISKANEAFAKLSLAQQRAVREAQRKSWVVGELMIEHPEMTKAKAEEIYERNKLDA